MLSVNTNMGSMWAQRSLGATSSALGLTTQRLSTGLRINSARDDPAGLAISERLRAQIGGLNVASRNANDAISMAQVGDAAAGSVVDSLQRMREIAVQASNGTLTSADRDNLQLEFAQLQSEVSSVVSGTDFNGITLLSGGGSTTFQVGANAGETITVSSPDLSSLTGAGAFTAATVTGATSINASAAISTIDSAITSATSAQATWGAYQNRFDSVVSSISIGVESLSAARGRIVDTDYAAETSNRARLMLLQDAGIAMLAQANAAPLKVLSLLTAA